MTVAGRDMAYTLNLDGRRPVLSGKIPADKPHCA
jgi:hypothetical protein